MRNYLKPLFKPVGIVASILLLLIPLASINSLMSERVYMRNTAISSASQLITKPQTIYGPWMIVEYNITKYKKEWNKEIKKYQQIPLLLHKKAFIRPQSSHILANMEVEYVQKSIYQIPFYKSNDTNLKASFDLGEVKEILDKDSSSKLTQVYIEVGISDVRGFISTPTMTIDGIKAKTQPGVSLNATMKGYHSKLDISLFNRKQLINIESNFDLRGVSYLHLAPLGFEKKVSLSSNWPHPNFSGDLLPHERNIDASGFSAQWQASAFSAGQAMQAEILDGNTNINLSGVQKFGVTLTDPVDIYRLNTRVSKYGILFILLTFTAFYLIEVLTVNRLHPVQYILVGLALSIFFLLTLSLSEKIGFAMAYLLATLACISLIGIYLKSIIGRIVAIYFCLGLALLYAAVYFILSLEQHSLIFGSLLIFITLGCVMYLTRNIDWYKLTQAQINK